MLRIDLFSLHLGINCSLHDLSVSIPSDLSSRFGSWGFAGEVMWCVGLKTYNRATFHYRIWRRNCKEEQTNKKTRYSSRPVQRHKKSHADIAIAVALSSASIYCNSKRGKQYLLIALCLFNKVLFQAGKRPRTVVILKKKHSTLFISFLGAALLLYLLLLLQSDVSTELLICSFICMVSHAPLASQACHPWWRRLSPQPIRESVNMGFVLAFLAPSTEPISLCVSELSEVLPLPRHGH